MRGWHYESLRHSLAARGIQTKGYFVPGSRPRFTREEIEGLRLIREMLRQIDGLIDVHPTDTKEMAKLCEKIYDRLKFNGHRSVVIRDARNHLMYYKRKEGLNSRINVIRSLEIFRFALHTNEELRNLFLGHDRNSRSEASDIAKEAFDIQAVLYRAGRADRYLTSKFIEERIE
jgi:hypothetical protein